MPGRCRTPHKTNRSNSIPLVEHDDGAALERGDIQIMGLAQHDDDLSQSLSGGVTVDAIGNSVTGFDLLPCRRKSGIQDCKVLGSKTAVDDDLTRFHGLPATPIRTRRSATILTNRAIGLTTCTQ